MGLNPGFQWGFLGLFASRSPKVKGRVMGDDAMMSCREGQWAEEKIPNVKDSRSRHGDGMWIGVELEWLG